MVGKRSVERDDLFKHHCADGKQQRCINRLDSEAAAKHDKSHDKQRRIDDEYESARRYGVGDVAEYNRQRTYASGCEMVRELEKIHPGSEKQRAEGDDKIGTKLFHREYMSDFFLKQLLKFSHEVIYVFELTIDRSETYIGDLVNSFELFHDELTDEGGRDLTLERVLEI